MITAAGRHQKSFIRPREHSLQLLSTLPFCAFASSAPWAVLAALPTPGPLESPGFALLCFAPALCPSVLRPCALRSLLRLGTGARHPGAGVRRGNSPPDCCLYPAHPAPLGGPGRFIPGFPVRRFAAHPRVLRLRCNQPLRFANGSGRVRVSP